MLADFRDFILRGNVVDLAVGLVAGAAFGGLVASLVANVVNPLIAFVVGSPDFTTAFQVTLPQMPWAADPATLAFGALLTTLITFLATMAGIFYFVVKPMNAAQARLKRDDIADEQPAEVDAVEQLVEALRRVRVIRTSDAEWSFMLDGE